MIARDHARVIARAAGDDVHGARRVEELGGVDGPKAASSTRGCFAMRSSSVSRDGARLLVDLLQHEVAVRAAFRGVRGQLALAHGALDGLAVARRGRGHLIARDLRDVAFLEEDERRVTGRSADTSDATKFSPMPRPSTSGQPARATTMRSGLSAREHARARTRRPAHRQCAHGLEEVVSILRGGR